MKKSKQKLYMKIPEGVNASRDKICRLNKSIYGLKQATRYWNDRFNIGLVSHFCSRFDIRHWNAIKRIFRCLISNKNYSILYRDYDTSNIKSFFDADYVSDIVMRRSTTGYIFQLANRAITWASKR